MAHKPEPKAVIRERRLREAKRLRKQKYSFAEIGAMLTPPMTAGGVFRMLGVKK